MEGRDIELDRLLLPFRKISASEVEIRAWQRAIENERMQTPNRYWLPRSGFSYAAQIAASLIIGIFIGGYLFSTNGKGTLALTGENDFSATIEYVVAKAE